MGQIAKPGAPGRPCGGSPANILGGAQEHHAAIQDFTPLASSLEWELGQQYLRQRGSKAFLSDAVPVPFAINNSGNMSVNAAELLYTNLAEAERTGTLEAEIIVVEIGVGLGLFARYFLGAFRDVCKRHGKDYYDRLRFIAADRSERMLVDACRHGVFSNHAGRYLLRVLDALEPGRDLLTDLAVTTQRERPIRAIFLNYLLDCLPAAVLELDETEVRQLYVRTCLARGAPLHEFTDLAPEALRWLAASPDPQDKRALLELFGLFASAYDYRPVDINSLPYGDLAVRFGRSRAGKVVHSYGAIQCLERLLDLLHENGFIVVNDYGSAQTTESEEFEHQRYTGSTFVGVNFGLLKAYFSDAGKCQWIEPAEDSKHIYSRLLGHQIGAETKARFTELFCKSAFDRLEEPAQQARDQAKNGRYEAAAAAFRRALERQPYNWLLMREVATFLAFGLREPAVGLEMARAALALNPACSADLWNALGDCLFSLGRIGEARRAFERALDVNPDDVQARYNLSFVFAHQKDFAAALKLIAEGLSLDTWGEYRERLLQKQAEVISGLTERSRQTFLFQANRVSTYFADRPARPTDENPPGKPPFADKYPDQNNGQTEPVRERP